MVRKKEKAAEEETNDVREFHISQSIISCSPKNSFKSSIG
jgi:hypothetical protein